MPLESASWIDELDATNPPGTDQKKQGDDHLRLIKSVLKACFPNADKAFYFPSSEAKTANFSILATGMNRTFLIDTTAGSVVATLPTLVAGDAGWECSLIKTTTDVNPYYIAPPSGTIQSGAISGLDRTRRCVPGSRTKVLWTGSAWVAERVVQVPVGTVLDMPSGTLPVGYEYANGQTLASAEDNYPDFYVANGSSGVTTDRRGRVAFGEDDMNTTAAGRLTETYFGSDPKVLGNVGGDEDLTIATTNLPPYTPSGLIALSHSQLLLNSGAGRDNAGNNPATTQISTSTATLSAQFNGIAQGGVSTPLSKIPPGIITRFMVVVE